MTDNKQKLKAMSDKQILEIWETLVVWKGLMESYDSDFDHKWMEDVHNELILRKISPPNN